VPDQPTSRRQSHNRIGFPRSRAEGFIRRVRHSRAPTDLITAFLSDRPLLPNDLWVSLSDLWALRNEFWVSLDEFRVFLNEVWVLRNDHWVFLNEV
jgi:hypothetical protein